MPKFIKHLHSRLNMKSEESADRDENAPRVRLGLSKITFVEERRAHQASSGVRERGGILGPLKKAGEVPQTLLSLPTAKLEPKAAGYLAEIVYCMESPQGLIVET